jgi:pimeloyl-ACP methyl ester carboxylesterase
MQKTLGTSGSTLSYSVYGKGESIVLIHGFGEDSRIWDQQVQFLQKNHQLIVPDLRGSGNSTMNETPLSMESMAEDIRQILDAEQISNCIMFGHSMGGYIMLAFAENHPSYLHAFGLIHSSAYADSDEKKEARNKSIAFIKEHGAYEFMKTTIPNLFAARFNEQQKNKVDELIEQSKQFSSEAVIGYYEAMIARPDRTIVLYNSSVPVFFFIGEEDKAVNPKDAIKQSALPAVCKIKKVSGIAHMGMLEATDELNKSIGEFIITVQQLASLTDHVSST